MDEKLKKEIIDMVQKAKQEGPSSDDIAKALNGGYLLSPDTETLFTSTYKPGEKPKWTMLEEIMRIPTYIPTPIEPILYDFVDVLPTADFSPNDIASFQSNNWRDKPVNYTLIALANRNHNLIVWNAKVDPDMPVHKVSASMFIDHYLEIENRNWYYSVALVDDSSLWYRAKLIWQERDAKSPKTEHIVFQRFHDHIWNYIQYFEIDVSTLTKFFISISAFDPTLPLDVEETELAGKAQIISSLLDEKFRKFFGSYLSTDAEDWGSDPK